MPFKRLPLWIAALLLLTVPAFWRGYYGVLPRAPIAFHIHGLTASLWLLLLGLQGWSARHRRMRLHAFAGRAGIVVFPLFLAGGAVVIQTMARATPANPFNALYGARLGLLDLSAMLWAAWLFHRALATRMQVQQHARYMVATILPVLSPIVGRLAGRVPPLAIGGPEELWKFAYAVQVGNLIALAIAVALYRRAPRHGTAFAVSAAVIVGQMPLFALADRLPVWTAVFGAIGSLPTLPLVAATLAAAGLLVWHGWSRGGRARARVSPAAYPA